MQAHLRLSNQFQAHDQKGFAAMAHDTVVFRIKDFDADSQLQAVPIHIPATFTLAEIDTWASLVANEIDDCIEGFIQSIELVKTLTLPGTIATSAGQGAQNERGGLIMFSTAIPKKYSLRLPGIKHTIMAGSSFSLAQTEIAALIARMISATTAANIRPQSDFEENLSAALSGKRSQRRR